jgi:hypothetical protein
VKDPIIDMVESVERGRRVLRIVDVSAPPSLRIPNELLRSPLHRIAQRMGKHLEGDFVTGQVRFA